MCRPALSASTPCSPGMNAPPTIAAHRIPEPCSVWRPRPSIASVKIVGNMTEFSRPTAMIVPTAVQPVVSTDVTTSSDAITACAASTFPALNMRSVNRLPMKRPIIAHSQ